MKVQKVIVVKTLQRIIVNVKQIIMKVYDCDCFSVSVKIIQSMKVDMLF